MKIMGYRKADFRTKDGVEVKGYNVYLSTAIDPRYGGGLMAERIYLSESKLAREGIDLATCVDRELRVYYNRYGKVDSIALMD